MFHPCWLCHTYPDFCFYDNERGKIDTLMLSIHIHDCSLSCLGTDTSIISGRVKLVAVMHVLPRVGKVLKYLGKHQYYKKTLYMYIILNIMHIVNPHDTKVVSSNPVHGEVYSIQHYVIKFVSDLR